MFKKILGDSPVTSIVGILAAFFVVLNEQLTTGDVTLVNALIAAAVAVIGRFLPDGPLKALTALFTPTQVTTEEPVAVEEPIVTEEPAAVEESVAVEEVETTAVKKTKK